MTRAVVTGAGGFIGRRLVRRLREAGTDVRAVLRSPLTRRFGPNVGELGSASAGVTYWAANAKARREFGYAPRDLEAGLSATFGRS